MPGLSFYLRTERGGPLVLGGATGTKLWDSASTFAGLQDGLALGANGTLYAINLSSEVYAIRDGS